MKRLLIPLSLTALVACVLFSFARSFQSGDGQVRSRRITDSATNVLHLKAGDSLQRGLDQAKPGDTILLESGATFVGPFTIPKIASNTEEWITVRGTQTLEAGVRVTPQNASRMPKLVSTGNGDSVLLTAPGAHHFRFIGIEFMPKDDSAVVHDVIALGNTTQKTLNEIPHHLVFDQCYIHGNPEQGTKRGIALNSAFTEILNSHISGFKVIGQDSQAICGWNGPGPFKIINNYLEAAAENIMFGGATPSVPNLVPSDIEVRNNHLFKPLSWRVGDPNYAGIHWSVKNLFELKNARRVVFDGNLLENSWGDGQSGFAILLTPRATGASWTVVEDVKITNNIVRHAGSGLQILGHDTYEVSQQSKRITVENNLFEDIDGSKWNGEGKFLVIGGGGDQIVFNHNTVLQSGNIMSVYGEPTTNFVFTNNIVNHNAYGVIGDGKGSGVESLNAYFPNAVFRKNVIIFGGRAGLDAAYPLQNFFLPEITAIKFVDHKQGNYRLAHNSPLLGRATDKTAIGCNVDLLPKKG